MPLENLTSIYLIYIFVYNRFIDLKRENSGEKAPELTQGKTQNDLFVIIWIMDTADIDQSNFISSYFKKKKNCFQFCTILEF